MAELLDEEGIALMLRDLPEWRREGSELVRDLTCKDFAAAIAFVNAAAKEAEAADHHPDLLVHGWNKVRVRLTTHSAGGLTVADAALATAIERRSAI